MSMVGYDSYMNYHHGKIYIHKGKAQVYPQN